MGMSFCLWGCMDGGDSVWADGRVCIVLIGAEYRIPKKSRRIFNFVYNSMNKLTLVSVFLSECFKLVRS